MEDFTRGDYCEMEDPQTAGLRFLASLASLSDGIMDSKLFPVILALVLNLIFFYNSYHEAYVMWIVNTKKDALEGLKELLVINFMFRWVLQPLINIYLIQCLGYDLHYVSKHYEDVFIVTMIGAYAGGGGCWRSDGWIFRHEKDLHLTVSEKIVMDRASVIGFLCVIIQCGFWLYYFWWKQNGERIFRRRHCRHEHFHYFADNRDPYHCTFCGYNLCSDDLRDQELINREEAYRISIQKDDDDDSTPGERSSRRGVSIRFLYDFTLQRNCWHLTAAEVIATIIKPETETTRCRYVELDHVRNYVGAAHTFISYAQRTLWKDLVAAVCHGLSEDEWDRRIWLDVFAVRQW